MSSAKISAGFLNFRHFLGLLLSSSSTTLISVSLTRLKLVPLGKYCLINPLVFSLVTFSPEEYGCVKKKSTPNSCDIFLNDQCTRLLSLVVIYYNAYLLSEVFKHKERFGTKEELAAFRHISLVAWVHINFYGHYNFSSSLTEEAVNKMLKDILCDSAFLFE